MIIDYKSGPRKFKLTPKRIRLVKHSLRRSLMATAKDQIADQKASDALLNTLQPEVGREIKAMIGAGNDSVLQTSDKNLSSFLYYLPICLRIPAFMFSFCLSVSVFACV